MERVKAFLERMDRNGEFDGITIEEARDIIAEWYNDSGDKRCEKILAYIASIAEEK